MLLFFSLPIYFEYGIVYCSELGVKGFSLSKIWALCQLYLEEDSNLIRRSSYFFNGNFVSLVGPQQDQDRGWVPPEGPIEGDGLGLVNKLLIYEVTSSYPLIETLIILCCSKRKCIFVFFVEVNNLFFFKLICLKTTDLFSISISIRPIQSISNCENLIFYHSDSSLASLRAFEITSFDKSVEHQSIVVVGSCPLSILLQDGSKQKSGAIQIMRPFFRPPPLPLWRDIFNFPKTSFFFFFCPSSF
jgi:hypothetical protein